ncbi:MAG: PBECR4 domain-containing protein [Lachnospiraceae bacterium]|nr:PBECR4 domain-containing protein [Lachnospiraceae bacterium]
MKYTQAEARRIALNCAKEYSQKLLGKVFLIIYRERQDNSIKYIEVIFLKRNYQHLTGLELIDSNGQVLKNQSENFFRKCLNNKLGLNEFRLKQDGTTHLKLAALPVLMDISKITKITGDYNKARPYLYVDKVIGGVNFCLGLSKEKQMYVPSSALLENIKKLTNAPSQVLAIFQKNMDDEIYSEVKHVAKGLNLNNISLPENITSKISLENYIYKNKK